MIIDSNILFSLMKPDSSASKIFELSPFKIVAPEFIKSELDEHEEECMKRSGLIKQEFKARRTYIEAKVTFISVKTYKKFLKKAIKALDDVDDVPYIALALALRTPVWSNDPDLKKQSLVDIFTTRELIELLPEFR